MSLDSTSTASPAQIINNNGQGVNGSGIIGAIKQASARTGVDFAYLMNKANQESGMNPTAKAKGSSASGLFQFIKETWLRVVKEHGAKYGLAKEADAISMESGTPRIADPKMAKKILDMRHDPVLASAMAAEFTRDNKEQLQNCLGEKSAIGNTELYMAHFLGANGAGKFLKAMQTSPQAAASKFFPQAAAANPGVFYKSGQAQSLKDIYDRFAAKFEKDDKDAGPYNSGASACTQMVSATTVPTVASGVSSLTAGVVENDFTWPAGTGISSDVRGELEAFKQNSATSSTLFNVMMLVQDQMKNALHLKSTDASATL
jgi:soluble lytic murein transglycosylase-like protein